MKHLTGIHILFLILFYSAGYSQGINWTSSEAMVTSEELNMLVGKWSGTLTYIDYKSKEPYSMPSELIIKAGKNENQILISFIYPYEPQANSKDKIIVSKDGARLNKKDILSKEILSDGNIQITTEYSGKDNKKRASIRNTYILGEKQFISRKEVQFEKTDDWLMRSEFRYKR